MKKKSVFANQTMRIGLLMLLDALLISASLLMGLQVYYDMHAPAAHILHVWRSLTLKNKYSQALGILQRRY